MKISFIWPPSKPTRSYIAWLTSVVCVIYFKIWSKCLSIPKQTYHLCHMTMLSYSSCIMLINSLYFYTNSGSPYGKWHPYAPVQTLLFSFYCYLFDLYVVSRRSIARMVTRTGEEIKTKNTRRNHCLFVKCTHIMVNNFHKHVAQLVALTTIFLYISIRPYNEMIESKWHESMKERKKEKKKKKTK